MPVIQRRRRPQHRRPRPQDRRPRRAHPHQQDHAGRARRRHLHADQHRQPRRAVRHPDHQPAAGRRSSAPARWSSARSSSTTPTSARRIAIRSMVYLALTYDHRLVDGADAARFLVDDEGAPRGGRLRGRPRPLADVCSVKVAVTGSSGLIGSALVASLRARRPRRRPAGAARAGRGSGRGPVGPRRRQASTSAARRGRRGRPPGRRRRRRHGVDRRVQAARSGQPGARHRDPRRRWPRIDPRPRCCCLGSAIGYYGDTRATGARRVRPAGHGVPRRGRARLGGAAEPAARRPASGSCHSRTGLVLSAKRRRLRPAAAAVPARPRRPARHRPAVVELDHACDDEVPRSRFLLDDDELAGPVNVTAPEPRPTPT